MMQVPSLYHWLGEEGGRLGEYYAETTLVEHVDERGNRIKMRAYPEFLQEIIPSRYWRIVEEN